jgi:hypothetical protein
MSICWNKKLYNLIHLGRCWLSIAVPSSMYRLVQGRILSFLQIDNTNLLSTINRGSPELPLNTLARKFFLVLPRKQNRYIGWKDSPRCWRLCRNDFRNVKITNDWSVYQNLFLMLDARWGAQSLRFLMVLMKTIFASKTFIQFIDEEVLRMSDFLHCSLGDVSL